MLRRRTARARGLQFLDVAVGQAVPQVPADRDRDHLGRDWLSRLGRREHALAAIEEAVPIRRQLADARPQVYSARLAASLQILASLLEAAGRKPEADTARAEAARLK